MITLVIGLGSMGKRRIRLIQKLDTTIFVIGVDLSIERQREAKGKFLIDTYGSINEAVQNNQPDCAFICTSPLSHNKIINQCLDMGMDVFSEINLVSDGYEENVEKSRSKNLKLFLSSTFLYRDEVRYIKERVNASVSPINYIYHIGQYLPDWHPWEDYTKYFVSDQRTNGCREIFAIEIPWILATFGPVTAISVIKSKNTNLNINYNDNYMVLLSHENGAKGTLIVDVVSRKAVRNLEVYSEELYISWDGSPFGLREYDVDTKETKEISLYNEVDKQEGYSASIIENAYLNEVKAFFQMIKDNTKPIYGFEDDIQTLNLIDLIEEYRE